jgi:PTS system mannose-specific IIA component
MIGIVLAAHDQLPESLLESARMILGGTEQIELLALMPDDNLEGLVMRMQSAIAAVNTGDGVLILLDLFGGTPSNAVVMLTQQSEDIHAVSGVNIPMLLETLMARRSVEEAAVLAETAAASGMQGIVNISKKFAEYRKREQQADTP